MKGNSPAMVEYFLNNRISAFMTLAALVTAGCISLYKLPVSLMPSADCPAVSILIEYPGVGPEKIEVLITKPVERIIKGVSGITEISSVSEDGKSRINVIFSSDTDIKIASVKLREKIELIKDNFPAEVQDPVVFRYDPSERPVIIAALEIPGITVDETRNYIEKKIKPVLQRVEGISEINTAGGTVKEIHVEVRRSSLEARGLTLHDLSSSLKESNISAPGGIVETGSGLNILSIPCRFMSLTDIENTVIYSGANSYVLLKDVAEVSFAGREKEEYSRYNGSELVTLYIHRGGGANTLSVCRESIKALESFSGIKLKVIYNQGEYIESAVNNAALSGLWSMLIVFLVLSVFLRNMGIAMPILLSIPCSMSIVPFFLYMGDRGLNIMSLSGFALSAGMVVDNGIVIVEAINSGDNTSIKGILKAVNSVKTAVISSTLTTVSVFAPVAILSSRAESMYGDMAFTVNRALVVSLFSAVILVPAFYLSFRNSGSNMSAAVNRIKTPSVQKILSAVKGIESAAYDYYNRILEYVFSNKFRVMSAGICVLSISILLFMVMDRDSMRRESGSDFYLSMEFPTGTSLDITDRGARAVEKAVSGMQDVETVTSKIEKWRGTLTIHTGHDLNAKRMGKLKQEMKRAADSILKQYGAFSYISETDDNSSKEITVHFLGDDTDVLKKITREVSARIKGIEGIEECYLRYREGRPEYRLSVDRGKSFISGVTASSVAERIRAALFGPVTSKFIENDSEVDVRVRLETADRDTIEHLMAGVVKSMNGRDVPIREVINLSEGEGPSRIYRLNGRKSLSVTAKTGNLSLTEAEVKIRQVIEGMHIPDEYSYKFDSGIEQSKTERKELAVSVCVSVILVYMILASLFESLLIPLLVMVTIPFAAAGSVPVLFITGIPVSPPVYMGFIMLAGIVVNNGILLAEPLNRDFSTDKLPVNALEERIRYYSMQRFRPVMLTVMTTVLGMVPLLVSGVSGGSLWFPFALTVTAGLLVSTFMTLALFPVLSFYFYRRIVPESTDKSKQ
jgi:HAE1 family hydrophobic/amphiphilic exporter-1